MPTWIANSIRLHAVLDEPDALVVMVEACCVNGFD